MSVSRQRCQFCGAHIYAESLATEKAAIRTFQINIYCAARCRERPIQVFDRGYLELLALEEYVRKTEER